DGPLASPNSTRTNRRPPPEPAKRARRGPTFSGGELSGVRPEPLLKTPFSLSWIFGLSAFPNGKGRPVFALRRHSYCNSTAAGFGKKTSPEPPPICAGMRLPKKVVDGY